MRELLHDGTEYSEAEHSATQDAGTQPSSGVLHLTSCI